MIQIISFRYDDDDITEVVDENISLNKAMEDLERGDIDFFEIRDGSSFIEITLSSKDEFITNGYQS